MSPFSFSILLHYYVSPCAYDGPEAIDAVATQVADFLREGMLKERAADDQERGARYRTTAKADVWLKHVLNTPYPEQHWIIPPTGGR